MNRPRRRDILVAAAIGVASAACVVLPDLDALKGWSIDTLTGLRWGVFGAGRPGTASPSVVIALDEETGATPPFAGTPIVTWTGEIGRVLTAVVDGGAKVVGFDLIFPTSIEQSEIKFGDATLGERMRGFDREFLRALTLAASSDKIVLGEVQHQDLPILPSPGQRAAVRQLQNIRPLNVETDADSVVRRMPLSFRVDGATVPSMAVELAARAQGIAPQFATDGRLTLGDYTVPAAVPNTMTLNFEGGAEDIPTYSLADLRACIEKGDAEFFRRNFGGKVVLIGTVLDSEDRKLSSKRFATAPEGARAARCATTEKSDTIGRFRRDAIAGVYLQATAVNNLIDRNAVRELGFVARFALTVVLASFMALAALVLGPLAATLLSLALAAAWIAGATAVFRNAVALPLFEPLIAGMITLGATIGYRFIISDRHRRLLRQSFGFYLAPQLIDRLVASNKPPALGGELRQISVFFSDIEGFSSIAERMAPRELVALINEYFRAVTDIVEAHDGFVDKYIGDAVIAVFGAPLDDPAHATKAVRAALACQARLAELRSGSGPFATYRLNTRIGVSSGEALVGNIGSRRHFNYTVMGDAVNIAARLENANRYFGTTVMASEATVVSTHAAFVWRELDLLRVKGRDAPVRVFEPLAAAEQQTAEMERHVAAYAAGLASWRARDFGGAALHFDRIAETDAPAAKFRDRAEAFARRPPPANWEPITAQPTI
jgi:adenylate cyclase